MIMHGENEMAMANDGANDGKLVVMYSIECDQIDKK